MKLLLHTCCAPCSIKCIEQLRAEKIEPTLFWYNPNIHPFLEYRNRKNALKKYADLINAKLIIIDEYGLRPFVSSVVSNLNERCEYCYRTRLNAVAKYAAENEFDTFSTTLLISPYQNHEKICNISKSVANQNQINFLYRDFRPFFKAGQQDARDLDLYMQKYCGCIFSEEERYKKSKK